MFSYMSYDTLLTSHQADKGNRIVEIQEQLTAALNQAAQAGSASVVDAPPADLPSTEELDTLKAQLSEARKALEDARANAESVAATASEPSTDVKADTAQGDAENLTLKAELDERENKLQEVEAALSQREVKVTTREGKVAEIQKKAQDKVHSIRSESNDKIAAVTKEMNEEIERLKTEIVELQVEINRLKEHPQQSIGGNNPTVAYKNLLDEDVPAQVDQVIDTESLARPTVTAHELKSWINKNHAAKSVIVEQIKKHIEPLKEQVRTKEAELAKLNEQLKDLAAKPAEPIKSESNMTQGSGQDVETALANAKVEHQKALDKALKMAEMRSNARSGMLQVGRDRWNAIEKISKESPTMEVSKAVATAVEESKRPKPAAAAAAQQPPTSSVASLPQPATASTQAPTQQTATTANIAPQANGTSLPGSNPTLPNQPVQIPASNPFLAAQSGRGMAQPGFAGQNPFTAQQQQQQQGGRGRGDGMGTGPRTLQGLFSNQSNIPRGGASNIPLPGGRGRGGQPQQQQQPPVQNQNQPPNNSAQGPGASQIGRGGNRGGRGGGRGGTQPNQSSPRNSLNPGATQFQPQATPGMGRGQKRGAEDEAEGGARGGKRPRGRGGQGGGGASQAE